MKLKVVLLTIITMGLAACNGMPHNKKTILHPYHSPQELIAKRALNQPDGQAKDYIYVWGANQKQNSTQAMYPRSILTQYCHEQGGKFSLMYKSQLSLVRESTQRKRLSANRGVTQGIGAYKCHMGDLTESWIVSVEPISERQLDKTSQTRSVRLLTRLMNAAQVKSFYQPVHKATMAMEKKTTVAAKAATPVKTPAVKNDLKESARKEQEKKELEKRALEQKELEKKAADKKLLTATSKPVTVAVETPQQQQMKLYVTARRDINSARNLNNACNNAQRAYNYGKQQGTEGTRVYTESGMLVARCLTSISAYSNRFPNAKGQAKRILNHLATQYNHSGAKNMLRQLN